MLSNEPLPLNEADFEKEYQGFKNHFSAIELDLIKSYHQLGHMYMMRGQAEKAIGYYKKALARAPEELILHYSLAAAFRYLQNYELATFCYRRILEIDPGNLVAKYGLALCHLPCFFEDKKQVDACYEKYTQSLLELEKAVESADLTRRILTSDAIGHFYPHYLAYQGKSVRTLQEKHGYLSACLMESAYPELSKPLKMPKLIPGERLRVGFVSSFFRMSSVWRIPLAGWIEQMDPSKIECFAYSVHALEDDQTKEAKQKVEHFVQELSFDAICQKIRSDNLHALIISDVGMEPLTTRIASLRLAPLQMTGLGHPVTTGLKTIDYFLSSEWMEPEGADEHYSEKLVQLPELGIHYTPPKLENESFDGLAVGLRADSVKYLCGQSLFKYLPQYDWILTEIAKQVPDSQFVFIAWPTEVSESFQKRFKKAFETSGLDPNRHLVWTPRVSAAQYRDLCRQCDVFLDTIDWSGFNTTMEAIHEKLPIVSYTGTFARGRHTLAICKGLDMMESVASTYEAYLALAVGYGLDPLKRKLASEKIEKNYSKLLQNEKPIRALEAFLERICQEKMSED